MAYEDGLTEMPFDEIDEELIESLQIDSEIAEQRKKSPESEEIEKLLTRKDSLKIASILYADHARKWFDKADGYKYTSACIALLPPIAISLYKQFVAGEPLDFSDAESAVISLYNTGNVYLSAAVGVISFGGAASAWIFRYIGNLNRENFERLTELRVDDAYATFAIEKRADYIMQKLGMRD